MTIDFSHEKPEPKPVTAFDHEIVDFLKEWADNTPTVSVQTSGSTGTPKTLQIDKQKMRQSARMTCKFLNIRKNTKSLVCLPVKNISGKMMVVRAMEYGHKLTSAEPKLNPLDGINDSYDFCALTPLQAEHSIGKLHLINTIILGGAAVSDSLSDRIASHLNDFKGNHRVFETFGMSETLSHIALKEIYPKKNDFFTTLDGVRISTDSRGCLIIFAQHLHPEALITNDIVEILGEKTFRFLGRADNIINSGGAKIYPEELEAFVKKTVSAEVVFVGLKDEQLGQKLVAVIEGEKEEEWQRTIMELPYAQRYQRPKEVYFVKELPRTANGKIDRISLLKKISQNG